MKNGVQPSSKDVEQQFRELRELLECFDPNLPTFWSSDLPWHYLAMAYEAGALADVLLGIEPQLRSLAERYERNPKAFLPARDDLFRRHAKRLGISWTESESSLSLTEFLEALTTRVRRALVNVAPLIKTILEGGNLPPSAGKEVFGCLRVLTSDSPGRPPKVTERERACDESVLSMSTEQPRIYAESLLKVCELSIESSLPCLSGIAGADLRRRVVSIMRLRAMPLGIAGRVVLTLFGIAAVGGPLALGLIQAQDTGRQMENTASLPSFEVAAIKPSKPDARNHDWDSNEDRVRIEHYSLRDLIAYAYGLKSNSQVLGGPDWIDKRSFDITAKVDQAEVVKIRAMSRQEKGREWHMMMQSLLTNRFGLKVHPGQKSMPVFALVIAKSGIRCKPAVVSNGHHFSIHNGHMTAVATSMDVLADYLTQQPETGHRVVVNRTGLTGDYDFAMDWTPDRGDGVPPDAQYPGLFTTLHEQLGLELKANKASVDAIVVDAAEKPEFDEH